MYMLLMSYSVSGFTFQSGYIQIKERLNLLEVIRGFTFQSGYIQMMFFINITERSSIFTFQSGYIQIFFGKSENRSL